MIREGHVAIVERQLSTDEYLQLRAAVNWPVIAADVADKGLQNSLYGVCAILDGHLVGCGRVVGDGAVYFYVQDVIVLPQYQSRRIGTQIMDAIMRWIDSRSSQNSFIGLMAAQDAAAFYYRYGFTERPADRPGMYKLA